MDGNICRVLALVFQSILESSHNFSLVVVETFGPTALLWLSVLAPEYSRTPALSLLL